MKNLVHSIMSNRFLLNKLVYVLAVACVLIGSAFVQSAEQSQTPAGSSTGSSVSPIQSGIKKEGSLEATGPMFVKFKDAKWEKINPELGDNSPEIAILHVDPKTKATQLMIRVPKNFHVPRHWHTANETHTIINGTFIMECEGKRAELEPGSFNYIPSKMIHQAWTKPDGGTLLFITTDGGMGCKLGGWPSKDTEKEIDHTTG
jgi:mannose-6-phosphate isomerase-like protein (cupin superfamily)